MCGCCVTLWPQTVWRATVTESRSRGRRGWGGWWGWAASDGWKGSLSGRAEPRQSQTSVWGETGVCVWTPSDPHILPRLFPLTSVALEEEAAVADVWRPAGRWFPHRRRRLTNLNITHHLDADTHKPTGSNEPDELTCTLSVSHLYQSFYSYVWL